MSKEIKTALKEHLLKHGVNAGIASDKTLLGLIAEFIEEHQSQFTPQVKVTDEEIKTEAKTRSYIMQFVDDSDGKFFEECFLIGAKWMRDKLSASSEIEGDGI